MKGLISLIVPVYNKEDKVEKCIKSILNQTYKKIEIIMIDDGSTDKTLKICRKIEKGVKNCIKKNINLLLGCYIF